MSTGMKLGVLFVIAFAQFAGLTSCTRKVRHDSSENILVISKEQQPSWIRNFNPLLPSGAARWPTNGAIYEPLMIFNRIKGEWQAWLAESYHWSDDHLQLSFQLKRGVKWSDGKDFSAEDVAFTFELLREYNSLDSSGVWSILDRIEVLDTHAISFHFKKVLVPGLQYIALQPIVARHQWQNIAEPTNFTNPNPIGTGPYTEVIRFDHQIFELGRNPHFRNFHELGPEKLRFPAFSSNEQANLALINGEVDWAGNFVPAIDRIFVDKNPEHHDYWFPLVGTMVYLYLNTTEYPYSLAEVRYALSLAINRSQLTRIAMYNYTRPADSTGLTETFASWKNPSVLANDWTSYKPEKARALLAELGFKSNQKNQMLLPDGRVWELSITVVSGWSDWIRTAQMIARDLSAIGIIARVRPLDFSAWFENVQKGQFQAAIGWSVESPSPYGYYRWLMSKATVKPVQEMAAANWHRFGDSRVDKLLKKYEKTSELDQQKIIAYELQELFAELKPALPLFPNPAWGAYNSRKFTGFPNKDNPYTVLSPNSEPDFVMVLTELTRRQKEDQQ